MEGRIEAIPLKGSRKQPPQPVGILQVDEALLKIQTVCAVTGLSMSAVYRAVAAGDFPAPVKRGLRCTRWPAGAVRRWLAEQQLAAAA